MPIVTATPRGQANGQVLTEFIDSVGTASVTYTYPKTQEWLTVRNIGTKAITATVVGASQTLQPGERWALTADFTTFDIVSSSGVQAFETIADEKGTASDTLDGKYLGTTLRLPKPSGLRWNVPFNVYRDDTGIQTDLDIAKFQPKGKTYYVSTSGTDVNDGLTPATPLSKVATALAKPDVDVVLLEPGMYPRNQGTFPSGTTRNVSIKGNGGVATISAHDVLTWTLETGSTYKASRASSVDVYDAKTLDANGDYVRLTKQTSIANVDANPGSWYTDGTTVYVRTSDSRVPDSNIRVYLNVKNAYVESSVTMYLENITFEGGQSCLQALALSSSAVPTVYGKNCKFKYSTLDNALKIQGATTFFKDCEAVKGYRDGFNYHAYNGSNCLSVEIDCIGRNNGLDLTDNTCNGSTTHDGNKIVRINGKYHDNHGPNVADVNSALSWAVGCTAYNSTADTGTLQRSNFYIDGQMWLDSCVSYGPVDYDFVVSPGTINVRNVVSNGKLSLASGAALLPY